MYWVSLQKNWKLQDVQAGLNVTIAFLCAGAIFVLVRYCWQLAARRVALKKDVPAYTLLSLNTIGEALDIIWLLRKDLFASRYHGLLTQCLFVVLLTCATLSSGFLARWCTRYGNITVEQTVNGSLAIRSTGGLLYAEIDTNATYAKLERANFPYNQLLEYLPEQKADWNFESNQWNSSWSMECSFTPVTVIPDVRATGNCTSGMWTEIPQSRALWTQMPSFDGDWTYGYDRTGWRANRTAYRDILMFMHGIRLGTYDKTLATTTDLKLRTIALHLEGVPWSANISSGCTFSTGPVTRASYTDFFCNITRATAQFKTADDAYYGAYPDADDVVSVAEAYSGHWANNFRKQSARDVPTTVIMGQEMARFYQSYLITKDTTLSPYTMRTMMVTIQVPQIHIIALVLCSLVGLIVVVGLINYIIFLSRNWSRLDRTPQSKLDWMLQTIRHDDVGLQMVSGNPGGMTLRDKLRHSRAFGAEKSEIIPLTDIQFGTVPSHNSDRKSMVSTLNEMLPDNEDGFERHSVYSGINGVNGRHGYPYQTQMPPLQPHQTPVSLAPSWLPFQPQNSYAPIGQGQPSPYSIMGHGHDPYNTAYDPGRR